jgi:hypothetical protein
MATDQLVQQAIEEASRLRDHGERQRDREVVSSTRRILSLLGELARSNETLAEHRLVPISEAIRLSGRSRNTIKGWVERGLLDGFRSPTNNELFVRRDQLLRLIDKYAVPSNASPASRPALTQRRGSPSPSRLDRHRLAEQRSLALHKRIAELIDDDPSIVATAQRRVARWLDGTERFAASPEYARRWKSLLSGPQRRLLEALRSDSEESRALRQSSPFAGVLSERERHAILEGVNRGRRAT